ncbi:hypothetical protein BRARA_D01541 [Brassica rapa]|uniref:AP180 N-terminal homology (ANTH) domain-containing protein n=1 Tax=Brassica campestris TaxID=3711 RepID=A0A397ZMY6_BRACM|nr:hypothetical protein BRARA_D01541 [Brassica rapa]
MAPSIRKAIGAVKDQTSIGIAKVASNTAPDLEVAIVKATRRDDFRSPPPRSYDYDNGSGGAYGGGYGGVPKRSRSYGDMNEIGGGRDEKKAVTPPPEMTPERIFGKMGHLQRLLDRFLTLRPTGLAKNSRMILIALYPVVRESFKLYADICEVLAVLLDKFFDMEYTDCVKAFDAYASAAKQIDELIAFYNWCKETGVARSSEYPEVQRITSKLLETLEEFVRDRAKRGKSPERKEIEAPPPPPPVAEEEEPDMNEIKALPPPESYTPPPQPEPEPEKPQYTEDLVNLREDGVTGDDQGNKFALALFAGPPGSNGKWEAFPSDGVTSAWQNPAAEPGKADWELALVETASNLEKQTAALGGGFDSLLLNGMYDQGAVRQHVSTSELTGGSASSVALPLPGKANTQILALPAPDGTVEKVNQDPFAASLTIPPPSYVQMAEMEKKQYLLSQEQQLWQQYQREGMRGQASLAKMNNTGPVPGGMPYGMPPVNGMGPPPPTGYYYNNPY